MNWLTIANNELGQCEIKGSVDNERIVEYHQTCSLHAQDDETPWCSAFVNWCLKMAGYHGTGLANARSWLNWGVGIDEPRRGAIVVLKRGASPTAGHVGFVISDFGPHLKVLGGNQSDRVKCSYFDKSEVLGYRWPREEDKA